MYGGICEPVRGLAQLKFVQNPHAGVGEEEEACARKAMPVNFRIRCSSPSRILALVS